MLDVTLSSLRGALKESLVLQLSILFAAVAFIYSLSPGWRWKLRHIPGPPGLPFVGNLHQFIAAGSMGDFLDSIKGKYGSVIKVFIAHTPVVMITDPKVAKPMLISSFNTFPARGIDVIFPRPLPDSVTELDRFHLLESQGELWRTLRPVWHSYLSHSESLKLHRELMEKAIGQVLQFLEEKQGQPIDIVPTIRSLTMEVVGTTAFGVSFADAAQMGERPAIVKASEAVISGVSPDDFLTAVTICVPVLLPLARLLSPLLARPVIKARRELIRHAQQLVEGTRRKMASEEACTASKGQGSRGLEPLGAQGGQGAVAGISRGDSGISAASASQQRGSGGAEEAERSGKGGVNGNASRTGSFLNWLAGLHMKDTGVGLEDHHLRAQCMSMILAGYETTSSALSFTVWHLVWHPKVQARLVDEIDAEAAAGNMGQDLSKYRYLEAVLNETLRLYPPAGWIGRLAVQDVELCGKTIPAGTVVGFAMWNIQRDPAEWGPDADAFRPERFLEEAPDRSPYAFLPFGGGPRVCPGKNFALQEAKLFLVRLLSSFILERHDLTGPIRHREAFTVGPATPIVVVPRRRGPRGGAGGGETSEAVHVGGGGEN